MISFRALYGAVTKRRHHGPPRTWSSHDQLSKRLDGRPDVAATMLA
jgi:hypothetical protein